MLDAGLTALALWWAAAGEPLNGLDATRWLLCFFAVEGNILRHAPPCPRLGRVGALPCTTRTPAAAAGFLRAGSGSGAHFVCKLQ